MYYETILPKPKDKLRYSQKNKNQEKLSVADPPNNTS